MKPGDIVKIKDAGKNQQQIGIFMGMRTFAVSKVGRERNLEDYVCAEVMWFDKTAPNGDVVSTIQANLIEVVNES